MARWNLIRLFNVVMMLAMGSAPVTSAQSATVEGVARAEDGGGPIPFALVRLIHADSTATPSGTRPQGITNADGRYRFVGLAAGRFRVQLLRIGFQPVVSEAVQVAAGETVQLALRVASQPVTLPSFTVMAEACVTAKEVVGYPPLHTLWQQARDGASVRMGLMAGFRYQIFSREEGAEIKADASPATGALEQSLVSDPKWAPKNAERNRSQRLSRGYYGPNDGLYVPNELDVLHEDFLKTHCLVPNIARGEGAWGLQFRPLKPRRDFLDVRGTIWLDSTTYLARRIDLEYMDGEESRGTFRLDFADVAVAGGVLRMPVGGVYATRQSRKNPLKRTEGKVAFTYSGFEEVRPR